MVEQHNVDVRHNKWMTGRYTELTKTEQSKREAIRGHDAKIKDLESELSSACDVVQFCNLQIQAQEPR